MAVIHIVLFKFQQGTSQQILNTFVTELRKLRELPCVLNRNLVVSGPSITTPIERSKGFNFCLVSYHKDRAALAEYQASSEHHHVTSKYMWPFNEDLMRFDFEADDKALDGFNVLSLVGAKQSGGDISSEGSMDSRDASPEKL